MYVCKEAHIHVCFISVWSSPPAEGGVVFSHRDLAWALTAHSCSHGLSRHFQTTPPLSQPTTPPSLSFALSRHCGWSRRCCCCCSRNSCGSLNLFKRDYPCYLCICYCYPWRTECCSIAGIGYEFRPISTKVVQGPSSGPPVYSEPCPIASVEPNIGEVLQGPRYIWIYICMYIYVST